MEKEARFRFIFETVPVGISWQIVGDPKTRLINLEHARLTGVPVDQALLSADDPDKLVAARRGRSSSNP